MMRLQQQKEEACHYRLVSPLKRTNEEETLFALLYGTSYAPSIPLSHRQECVYSPFEGGRGEPAVTPRVAKAKTSEANRTMMCPPYMSLAVLRCCDSLIKNSSGEQDEGDQEKKDTDDEKQDKAK